MTTCEDCGDQRASYALDVDQADPRKLCTACLFDVFDPEDEADPYAGLADLLDPDRQPA